MTDVSDRARSRTFVVTGAASGIGLATAQRLLAEGGTVVRADVAAPPDLSERFTFVTADVSDEAAVADVFEAVPDRLDGLVHAAGIASGGPVHLLDKTEWDRVIAINLTGTFLVAKAALARMIEQPRIDGERGSSGIRANAICPASSQHRCWTTSFAFLECRGRWTRSHHRGARSATARQARGDRCHGRVSRVY